MANIETTQTPNPAPVDTPSIVTSLNTDTGPQASPQSFGPDLNGLAQGLDSANQDLQQTLYRSRFDRRETQNAQNELTALAATSALDKKYTGIQLNARAAGQHIDADQFDSQFQTDVAAGADKMPNVEARASYMAKATSLGLGFYKNNLEQTAEFNQRARTAQYSDIATSLVNRVNSGAISLQEGQSQLQIAAGGLRASSDAIPGITSQANASMVQGAITNIAQTHGAGVAALAVRNGIGGDAIQEPHQEILATQLDAQQIISNKTRAWVAQKNVDDLAQKASAGGFVSNADTLAAAKELAEATTAKPVDSNAPDLTEYIQSRFDYLQHLASSVDGSPLGQIEYRAAEKMELANDGKLIEQRLNTMAPDEQRLEISKMADALGQENPLVQHAAQIAGRNIEMLTPTSDNYSPASVAMKSPFVQAGFQNAQNAMATAVTPQDKGKAQGLWDMAVDQSFTAQKLLGVPAGSEKILTREQAETYGTQLNAVDPQTGLLQAPKIINQLQSQYGPDYSKRAIQEIVSTSKFNNGAAMLWMLNPDSQKVGAGANLKAEPMKADDPTMVTVKQAMAATSGPWADFWKSQQSDYGSSQRREYMEAAMPNMVKSYMANGDDAKTAFNKVVADTIGNAYTVISTTNGQFVAVPTTLTKSTDVAKAEMHKADVLMNGAIASVGLQGGPGNQPDQGTLSAANLSKGYWHFDTKNNAWARMVDDDKGTHVVELAGHQPLMIDASKLQGRTLLQGAPTGWFGQQPDILAGVHWGGVPEGTVGVDGFSLLVKPPGAPDQSPILKAPAPAPTSNAPALPPPTATPPQADNDPNGWRSGAETTHYGYSDDNTPDKNSRNGIGAFDNPLSQGAVALSPSMEKSLHALPGDVIEMYGSGGERRFGYFADRTSQKLTNDRIDLYDPHGSESKGAPFQAVSYRNAGGGSLKLKGRYLTAMGERNIAMLEGASGG